MSVCACAATHSWLLVGVGLIPWPKPASLLSVRVRMRALCGVHGVCVCVCVCSVHLCVCGTGAGGSLARCIAVYVGGLLRHHKLVCDERLCVVGRRPHLHWPVSPPLTHSRTHAHARGPPGGHGASTRRIALARTLTRSLLVLARVETTQRIPCWWRRLQRPWCCRRCCCDWDGCRPSRHGDDGDTTVHGVLLP